MSYRNSLLCLLICLIPLGLMGYTAVTGDVSGQTWNSGVYLVNGSISVSSGTTLTINSGAIVKFNGGTLNVYGNVVANYAIFTSFQDDFHGGDTNADGDLTSPAPGQWQNISCYNTTDANLFQYCQFYYGGSNMLSIQFGPAGIINHCTFSYANGTALYISSVNQSVQNSSFFNNNGWAAQFSSVTLANYPGNAMAGNLYNSFYFGSCTVTDSLNWTGVNSFHPVISTLTVAAEGALQLEPGAIIKNNGGAWYVNGSLIAIGTAAQPIVITSWQDDAHGGDANGDGYATLPAPGQWQNISCYNTTAANQFQYCDFYYGGGTMLNIQYGPAGSIDHCTFSYANGTALYIHSVSQTVEYCTFTNNNGWAAQFTSVTLANYPGNTLSGNLYNSFYFGSCTVNSTLNWTGVNSFHPVISTLTIAAEGALQLEPGAIIKNNGGGWYVNGSLTAIGTAAQPIVITSWQDDAHGGDANGDGNATLPAPGQWQNISCYNTTAANQFQYCDFYYGGGTMLNIQYGPAGSIDHCTFSYANGTALYINSVNQTVENCTFSHNIGSGLQFYNTSAELVLSNCTFTNNSGYAASFSSSLIPHFSGMLLTNNTLGGFRFDNCTISGNVTWSNALIPFVNGLTVPATATLEIVPGTVVKNHAGTWYIQGTLIATGTASQPIIFTSFWDDAHGGDTNGDGNANLPAPNQWGGISYTYTASVPHLEYCEFWYGGYGTNYILYMESVPSGYVGNCAFHYSGYYGLYLYSSNPTVENCTFRSNSSNGLRVYNSGASFTMRNCTFDSNNNHPAYFSNSTITQHNGITITNHTIPGFRFDNCTISGNVTWSNVLNPFVSGLTVPAAATLEIVPGTVVKNHAGAWNIQGTLIATGTASHPIIFTSFWDDAHGGDTNGDGNSNSPTPSQWGGISYSNTTVVPHLEYCEFWYGGYSTNYSLYMESVPTGYIGNCTFRYSGYYGIYLNYSNPTVENCVFSNNSNSGLRVNEAGAAFILRNCSFNNNNYHPAYFSNSAITQYSGMAITNHTIPGFRFDNCTISGTVTWSNVLKPFVVGLTIPASATLEILPGTVVKNHAGTWYIQGHLLAHGLLNQPIIFTSYYDDTHGGDANGDGSNSLPTPGHWGGLNYSSTTVAPELDYCEFWYGAYGTGYLVYMDSVPGGLINHCTFRYSQNFAIQLNNSSPMIDDCLIRDNLNHGINLASSSPTIRRCRIQDNNGYGILIQGSSLPVIGTVNEPGHNYFGHNNSTGWQIYNQTSNQISAVGNIWDWTNPVEIDAHIYDNDENTSYGNVVIEPISYDSPAAPEITDVQYTPDGIIVTWNPVTTNTIGNLITVNEYKVEISYDPYGDASSWYTLGTVNTTSALINGPAFEADRMFFRVRAVQ